MSLIEVILLSTALAMDAFAVSISVGISARDMVKVNSLKCGVAFGIFQGGMLAIGMVTANALAFIIAPFSHWIGFALLMFIGIKMIYEALATEETVNLSSFKTLIILSIATSIDALAAGISLAVVSVAIALPIIFVTLITFTFSYFGVFLGATISKNSPGKVFDIIGGCILIFIGIKTIVEHFA